MAKRIGFALLALVVISGVASAQTQVRLDPSADGAVYTNSGSTFARHFFTGPQIIDVTNHDYYYSSRETAYVLKFDLSGISEVLDARLIVYFASRYNSSSYLFWQNGGNESSSPSYVSTADLPQTKARNYVDNFFGPGGGPNSGFYSGASWDITDEVRSDLPGGHSDYVIQIRGYSMYGGYEHYSQQIFTTHLGQQPNGGDAQGSPFGPYVLYTPGAIPEPGTLALLGLGLVSLGVAYRRRRRKAA